MGPQAPIDTILECSQCGRALAQADLVQIAGNWVCAECKTAFLSRVMASGADGASLLSRRYGGFWIRFGARMIDGLVFMVPIIIFSALLIPNLLRAGGRAGSPAANAILGLSMISFFVTFFLLQGCYEILMLKYRSATLGKMACGLTVIRSDGQGLGWAVCFGRFFMWNVVTSGIPYINTILMLVSSIMLGADDEKRALHDRVCNTRVIHKHGAL
jgi:uncharacterized RDD family membrane protein YckC